MSVVLDADQVAAALRESRTKSSTQPQYRRSCPGGIRTRGLLRSRNPSRMLHARARYHALSRRFSDRNCVRLSAGRAQDGDRVPSTTNAFCSWTTSCTWPGRGARRAHRFRASAGDPVHRPRALWSTASDRLKRTTWARTSRHRRRRACRCTRPRSTDAMKAGDPAVKTRWASHLAGGIYLVETAEAMRKSAGVPSRRAPALPRKTVVNLLHEPSTHAHLVEIARGGERGTRQCRRLGEQRPERGETLVDTGEHRSHVAGHDRPAPRFVRAVISCRAHSQKVAHHQCGDGMHEHPTQAAPPRRVHDQGTQENDSGFEGRHYRPSAAQPRAAVERAPLTKLGASVRRCSLVIQCLGVHVTTSVDEDVAR